MRIGINALYLIPGGVGGTEIYLRNLLKALAEIDTANEYFVFTNRETGADLVPPAVNFHRVPQQVEAVNRPMRLLWEQVRLPREAARLQLHCLFNPGFTAPVFSPCPNITVFHDLQHKRHPEHFRTWDLPFWNLFLGLSLRSSKLIVADSEATRLDLQRFYPRLRCPVITVPLGVEEQFFRIAEERGATEPFLLCVSTTHPHKNLPRLVKVFKQLKDSQPGLRLVIAGLRGFGAEELEQTILHFDLASSVEMTGWIPREQLYELYRKAHAFVYPSTFEGFGLPVVEAMAAGIPLACSSIEPLRSIAGDGAIQFEPDDEAGMLQALEVLTMDIQARRAIVARGRDRAKLFRWDRSAQLTLEALRSVAAG